jgi:hypothetical protein
MSWGRSVVPTIWPVENMDCRFGSVFGLLVLVFIYTVLAEHGFGVVSVLESVSGAPAFHNICAGLKFYKRACGARSIVLFADELYGFGVVYVSESVPGASAFHNIRTGLIFYKHACGARRIGLFANKL